MVGEIYPGIVSSIMQFGCFVQLRDFAKKIEGLVHISNLREEGRVNSVTDVVTRHQKVFVKVLSLTGSKVGLSMKDADQFTGADLNPQNTCRLREALQAAASAASSSDGDRAARNPDRPDYMSDHAPVGDDDGGGGGGGGGSAKKKVKQISDFERWELQQLRAANAIQLTDLPYYDEETGILQKEEEEEDVDVEIELVEDECAFLKGYSRKNLADLSPVKIVKNPDGSLQQAAMMQGALTKERREMKIAQQEALAAQRDEDEANVGDVMRPDDPFAVRPDANAQLTAGSNKTYQLADWKKSLLTGSKGSYGRKTNMSMIEQREGLPIFKVNT